MLKGVTLLAFPPPSTSSTDDNMSYCNVSLVPPSLSVLYSDEFVGEVVERVDSVLCEEMKSSSSSSSHSTPGNQSNSFNSFNNVKMFDDCVGVCVLESMMVEVEEYQVKVNELSTIHHPPPTISHLISSSPSSSISQHQPPPSSSTISHDPSSSLNNNGSG